MTSPSGGPRTLFSGKTAPGDQKRQNPKAVVCALLVLFAPIGAVVALTWIWLFLFARISYRWIGAAALILLVTLAPFGAFGSEGRAKYVSPYIETVKHLTGQAADSLTPSLTSPTPTAPTAGAPAPVAPGTPGSAPAPAVPPPAVAPAPTPAAAPAADAKPKEPALPWPRWGHWILAQLPIGLFLGTLFAFLFCSYKHARRATWEDADRARRRGPMDFARIKRNTQAMSAGTAGPKDGLRLGIETYGELVVHTDDEGAGHALVTGGTGAGKALDVNTEIPTPDGFVRMGDLTVGDFVYGPDGQPVRVVGAFDVQHDRSCYEVVFGDGTSIVADAEHLWLTETVEERKSRSRQNLPPKERTRKQVLSDSEVALLTAARDAATPGQVLTLPELASDLGRPGDTWLYSWARNLVPIRAKASARAYDRRELLSIALDRGTVGWNDQRHRAHQPGIRTTAQIKDTLRHKSGRLNHSVPPAAPVQYPHRDLPVDPYLLGVWLGDGNTYNATVASADPQIVAAFFHAGYNVKRVTPIMYSISNGFLGHLRAAGVLRDKHIPSPYLHGSVQQRRDLLAGLMDTDGTVERGRRVSYTSSRKELAEQARQLAHSLGYDPTLTYRDTYRYLEDGTRKQGAGAWLVAWSTNDPVFRLDRKREPHLERAAACSPNGQTGHRMIVAVREVPSRPVRCIRVENDNGLFLAGRQYVTTHNTVGVLTMIRDAIALGRCVIYVDIKGGPDVAAHLADLAARHGRVFRHWSLHDPRTPYLGPADAPAFYDPISRGDASRRKDLLVGSQKWDVEYYKTVVENYVQTALTVSDLVPPADGVGSFKELADLLNPAALKQRALRLPVGGAMEELQHRVSACTDNMDEQEKSGIRGMASKLLILTGSVAGAWLRRDPKGTHDIDLGRAARNGEVVVFTLDSSNYESLSGQVAGLIVQDLKTLSSELRYDEQHRRTGKPVHIVLDEFSAAGSVNVLGLLNKARDANMRVMVATQALADLVREEPQFAEQVMGIVGSFIIFRANYHADAEVYAGLTGAVRKDEVRLGIEMNTGLTGAMTEGAGSGSGMITKIDGFRVEARDFQDLPRGVAVYVATTPKRRVVFPVQVVREGAVVTEVGPDGSGPTGGIGSAVRLARELSDRFRKTDAANSLDPQASPAAGPVALARPGAGSGTGRPAQPADWLSEGRAVRPAAADWTGLPGEREADRDNRDRGLPEDRRALSQVHFAEAPDDDAGPSAFAIRDDPPDSWGARWGTEDMAGLETPAIPVVDRAEREPAPARADDDDDDADGSVFGVPAGDSTEANVPRSPVDGGSVDSAVDPDEWKRT